jgi:hypothetical protein
MMNKLISLTGAEVELTGAKVKLTGTEIRYDRWWLTTIDI